MRLTRSYPRRAALALTASGIVAAALLVAPGAAQAAPTPRIPIVSPNPAAAVADTLVTKLGERGAGAYRDSVTGNMVVNVTDAAAADTVRASGAVPRIVAHSQAQLDRATADLDATARIPGTSWASDPITNQVVVTYDSTVTGAKLDQLKAAVAKQGGAARLEASEGTLSTKIAGGQAIYGGGYRCSLGFNVVSGSTYYFLTAGHCAQVASTWYSNSGQSAILGTNYAYSFPSADWAVVRYSTSSTATKSGTVYTYSGSQDITSAANAYVGESVRRSGSTTGVRSGTVTALNATVNYAEGSVYGLIRTNVCAEGGDSGGALYDGTIALGLTSGGSGNCSIGGTTYFQPVTTPLNRYGLSVF